jgi:hypothetical protein
MHPNPLGTIETTGTTGTVLNFVPHRLQHLMHWLDINDQRRQLQFFFAQ